MLQTQLSYAQIGRMVLLNKPEVVNELLLQRQEPREKQLSAIGSYYDRFLDLHPSGNLKENVERRRLFIAAIFHLYQPEVFTVKTIKCQHGLCKAIADTVGVHKVHVSIILREVVIMEKAYDDFRSKVQNVLEEL